MQYPIMIFSKIQPKQNFYLKYIKNPITKITLNDVIFKVFIMSQLEGVVFSVLVFSEERIQARDRAV